MFGFHNLMLNVTNMWNDQFKTSQQLWIDMKQIYVCKNLYIKQDFDTGQLYQIMLSMPFLSIRWICVLFIWQNVIDICHLNYVDLKDYVNKLLSNMNFFIALENGKSKTRC
jgi:hypothetical protein